MIPLGTDIKANATYIIIYPVDNQAYCNISVNIMPWNHMS